MCIVTFCASGGCCSVPLHTLLTDYVEATGGASELRFNKVGTVAPSEMLDRHIMKVSTKCEIDVLALQHIYHQIFSLTDTRRWYFQFNSLGSIAPNGA